MNDRLRRPSHLKQAARGYLAGVVLAMAAALIGGSAVGQTGAEAERPPSARLTLSEQVPGGAWTVVYNDFAPFSITLPDGTPSGYAVDLIRALAADEGVDLVFRHSRNPGEGVEMIRLGEAQIHPNLADTEERRSVLAFSAPIETIRLQLYARPEEAERWAAGPEGARVGVAYGSLPFFVLQRLEGVTPVSFETNEAVLFGLASGTVDLAFYDRTAFDSLTRLLRNETAFVSVGEPVREIPIRIAVDRRKPELLARIDERLVALKASARFGEIKNRWFGAPPPFWDRDRVAAVGGAALLAIILVSAAAIVATRTRAQAELMREATARLEEQERFSATLSEKNGQLERKRKEMEQLLYVVSHDLNSPLVSISGFARHAQRNLEQGREEQARQAFDRIAHNAANMSGLIKGILDVGRVGRAKLTLEEVDVGELVDDVRLRLSGDLESSGAVLAVSGRLPRLAGDPMLLGRALQNLVANAIRHGVRAPGDRIEISAEERHDGHAITVRGHGPGVPLHAEARIFGLYQRLDETKPGQGMGLAIVRTIAEMHGGDAWVEPTPGGGATFRMTVSSRIEAHPPQQIEEAAA